MKIFDAHVHVFPDKIAKKATDATGSYYGIKMYTVGTFDNIKKEIASGKVNKCLIHSTATKASQVESVNDYISSLVHEDNDLIGFGSMHADYPEIESEIERMQKLGVTFIPGTLQLTKKDITYRANAAGVSAIVCVDDEYVISQVEASKPDMPGVKLYALVDNVVRDGWVDFNSEVEKCSDVFLKTPGSAGGTDIMQIYFTSGTTGMPKMVMHNYLHPLGHIVTAKYWQCVEENKLHMSVSDSGWAKFGWGKIYGQWICGATVFCYDMKKFVPKNLLSLEGTVFALTSSI